MNYFYEPVNLLQWNIFKKVKGIGHVEAFLATKQMKCGDILLLHVGTQVKEYESGIYAYGKIISEPYIFTKDIRDYCYNQLSVDVEIIHIQYDKPLITTNECKQFLKQFRSKHMINKECYSLIENYIIPRKRVIFANVTYMEQYIGEENYIFSGGAFVKENGFGYEDRNFLNVDGYCYGFVQSKNLKINLQRIDSTCIGETLDDVTVIFTASGKNGRTIVGYYKNAIVYSTMQPSLDQSDRYKDGGYYFKCKKDDAYLIAPSDRTFKFPNRKKDNIGQSNVWYADTEKSKDIVNSALSFINETVVVKDSGEILDPNISYIYEEGNKTQKMVNVYERNNKLRHLCIKKYGYVCQVCGVCLEDVYGKVAHDFIHVHHIKPISEYGYKHEIDALNDLVTVCPNCHAMIHRTINGVSLSIEELKEKLKSSKIKYR